MEPKVLTVVLPVAEWIPPARPLHSWRDLPTNPADGYSLVQSISELQKDDFRYYCDSCQHGYNSHAQWKAHLDDHIYCDVPGCNFTCRRDKEWKMDIHRESLHNRPDAPNLQDNEKYIAQRKSRFPTKENIEAKVEELYYKTSRGEILPSESRRWLRSHGVYVLRNGQPTREPPPPRQRRERPTPGQQPEQQSAENPPPSHTGTTESLATEERRPSGATGVAVPPAHRRPKLIPEGFNGKLSQKQRLQLIREKYREATEVPSFYVCHRCGEKGGHWVSECPTIGDTAFDRMLPTRSREETEDGKQAGAEDAPPARCEEQMNAEGKELRKRPRVEDDQEESAGTICGVPPQEPEPEQQQSDDAVLEVSARNELPPGPHAVVGHQPQTKRPGRRTVRRQRPPPPTLFDRLVEDERIHERGLLLQAIRYFVSSNFFGQGPQPDMEEC